MQQLTPLIQEFEERWSCQVVALEMPWVEIRNRLERAALTQDLDSLPDVISISSQWFSQVAPLGILLDLTDYWKGEREPYRDVFPGAFELWQDIDGALLAYPFDLDIQALLYNQELFEAAGVALPTEDWMWDDLLEAAVKLTVPAPGSSQPSQYGFTNWYFNWATLVWANGGSLVGTNGALLLSQPQTKGALEFYRQFWSGPVKVVADEEAALAANLRYPPQLWQRGQVAMMPAGSWAPKMWTWNSKEEEYLFDFGVAHFPASPIGRRAVEASGQGVAIIAGSKNVSLSLRFLEFLLEEDVQRLIASVFNQFPVRYSVAFSPAFLESSDGVNKQIFAEAAQYARPMPRTRNWHELWPIVQRHVSRYLRGQVEYEPMLENLAREVQVLEQKR